MLNAVATPEPMPLLTHITSVVCHRCGDLGIRWEPSGRIAVCPVIQLGLDHPEPNAAAQMLRTRVGKLQSRGIAINSLSFDVARALTYATSGSPTPRQTLLNKYYGWASSQLLRKFHATIEELRTIWLLPVGSRKELPHGYWIITNEDDFSEWAERSKGAAITVLSRIHRLAKANYPVYAEQMELEFWKDMGDSPDEISAA